MDIQEQILHKLVVVKSTQMNERQGFVTPILKVIEDEKFEAINKSDYPVDILVSKDFPLIDENYEHEELFLLRAHNLDIEKTQLHGQPRYWAKDETSFANLTSNILLPILEISLPQKETGLLPSGIIPPRGAFFIHDDDYIYGPLISPSSQTDDGDFIIEPFVHPSLSFGKGYIGKFKYSDVKDSIVSFYLNGKLLKRVNSFKELSNHKTENCYMDYLSDDQLIKVLNQQGFGKQTNSLGKKDAERLQQIIAQSEKINKIAKQDERLERLKKLLDRYLTEADSGFELIKAYLNSSAGQRFLSSYVEQKGASLLGEHLEKVKEKAKVQERIIQEELEQKAAEVVRKQQEIENIEFSVIQKKEESQLKIAQIEAETEEKIRQQLAAQEKELSEQVSMKQTELDGLNFRLKEKEHEVNEKLESLKLVDNIQEITRRREYLSQHIKELEYTVKGYTDTLKGDDNSDLAKKIGELQAITRVLNGSSIPVMSDNIYKPVVFCDKEPKTAEDVVKSLSHHFTQDNGRLFSIEEMTNLIVSVNQSFLTILSGPPGTGKTTTATRLAKALHLGSSTGDQNFLYIPVGRGWVSSRDLLGFYNSLKNVYQESRTGLYNFLKRKDKNADRAMKLILLDEANLSSMEHYWSDFLSLCDYEHFNRPIDTGIPTLEDRFIYLNENTRFIATINNDATTEKLSPRLIDRAPVIRLNNITDQIRTTADIYFDGAIPAEIMRDLFIPEYAQLSKSDDSVINKIIESLNKRDSSLGQQILISQRKINAITNYCDIAGKIIGTDVALDFAIQQHILPHIEGYGSSFKKRLQNLSELINKTYPRSAAELDRIISSGNEFTGTYSYF